MARNELPARSTVRGAIVFTVVAISALIPPFPAIARAQLLGRASDAARGSDDGASQGGSDDRSSDDDDDDDRSSSDDDGLLGSASRAARGRSGHSGGGSGGGSGRTGWHGPAFHRSRAAVPYSSVVAEVTVDRRESPPEPVAARLELEGGYVLAGAGRAGAAARLGLPWSLDLTARYSLFVEPLEGGFEALALGRIGLDWRVVDEESAVVRIGGGLRHLQDHAGGLFGADAVLGVDVFVGPPVILSLELGVGFVGKALLVQARGSLGFAVGGCEIYVGYDFEGLWSSSIGVDLGGPMLGVRAWL